MSGKEWFEDVFMKSFDERLEEGQSCWVTENQVRVLRKYMKEKSVFPTLYVIIGAYQYDLSIKKNGYGRLTKIDRRSAYR